MNDLQLTSLIVLAIAVIFGVLPLMDWGFDRLVSYLKK